MPMATTPSSFAISTSEDLVVADNPAELRRRLDEYYPGRAIAFPHHIGYRQGARGINWSAFDETLSPVVEMISMHGCSEASLGDRPFLHSMGPSDGRSTVRHGLALGHVFGLLGNTDHHSGYPGSYGHGRTCVYAAENTREALWRAIHQRGAPMRSPATARIFSRRSTAIRREASSRRTTRANSPSRRSAAASSISSMSSGTVAPSPG